MGYVSKMAFGCQNSPGTDEEDSGVSLFTWNMSFRVASPDLVPAGLAESNRRASVRAPANADIPSKPILERAH